MCAYVAFYCAITQTQAMTGIKKKFHLTNSQLSSNFELSIYLFLSFGLDFNLTGVTNPYYVDYAYKYITRLMNMRQIKITPYLIYTCLKVLFHRNFIHLHPIFCSFVLFVRLLTPYFILFYFHFTDHSFWNASCLWEQRVKFIFSNLWHVHRKSSAGNSNFIDHLTICDVPSKDIDGRSFGTRGSI